MTAILTLNHIMNLIDQAKINATLLVPKNRTFISIQSINQSIYF